MSESNSTSLTAERLRELLHYDPETGVFTRKVRTSSRVKVGEKTGSPVGKEGYWRLYIDGIPHYAHRLAWLYVYGEWPAGEIDHVNRLKGDNRWANLRPASRSENMQNTPLSGNNTSGFRGVSLHKRDQRWHAQITHQGRKLHLGYFVDIDDAIAARKVAEARLHPYAAN